MNRLVLRSAAIAFWLILIGSVSGQAHQDVDLLDENGVQLTAGDTVPYSPKQTCGECHDYDAITSGYHFQQGFDEASDTFSASAPWVKSPGMYGKW